MIKIIFLWLLLTISSPLIVLIGSDQFQESGWFAIGGYNFDIFDGVYRSVYFFFVTAPVIAALYLGRPTGRVDGYVKLNIKASVRGGHVFLMILFCLLAFYFNLGITGVETETGGLRLSGLVHYVRSYLFLFFVGIYVFGLEKPSLTLVVIYSFVSGLTGGSRFAAVAPLVLMLIRRLYDDGGVVSVRGLLICVFIFLLFSFVTFFRIFLYDEGYSFDRLWGLIRDAEIADGDFIFQGFSQLFLRIGIGRDVILSYEIGGLGVCRDLWGLFFKSGSCMNPPFDFYGLRLDDNKFYLAPPMLSSLFVVSDNFLVKLMVSVLYSLLAYVFCLMVRVVRKIPLGNFIVYPSYFLIAAFIIIGPIFFAWIMLGLILSFYFIHLIVRRACKVGARSES